MKLYEIFLCIYFFSLFFSMSAKSKEIPNGKVMYNQAIYFLKKNDYKNAFLYFSGSCYNNYLPGCDMMGVTEYQIDKNKGTQICKDWIDKLSQSKNQNDQLHLKNILKYYIDIFKQFDDKDLSNYFQKRYNKMFLQIKIEKVNPNNHN